MGKCISKSSKINTSSESNTSSNPKSKTVVDGKQNNEIDQSLEQKCPPLDLCGEVVIGYCVRIIDGDTCVMNLKTKFGTHQWKIRMDAYDSPEMKGKTTLEKQHARACKKVVEELILNKYCVVECKKFEKYGRLLAVIYIRGVNNTTTEFKTMSCVLDDANRRCDLLNITTWMVQNTTSVEYFGGHKTEVFVPKIPEQCHPMYNRVFEEILNTPIVEPEIKQRIKRQKK